MIILNIITKPLDNPCIWSSRREKDTQRHSEGRIHPHLHQKRVMCQYRLDNSERWSAFIVYVCNWMKYYCSSNRIFVGIAFNSPVKCLCIFNIILSLLSERTYLVTIHSWSKLPILQQFLYCMFTFVGTGRFWVARWQSH